MKRKGNLYKDICEYTNIEDAFDEVCRNTKNKNKVARFREYKCIYISRIHKILNNREYTPGPCNVFIIHDPKTRRIVSQNMVDKVVNHLVSRNILYPAILPCLLDVNVASRRNLGTSEGLRLAKVYHNKCTIKYKKYYILKFDISKFFASIDHNLLMKKLQKRIKDKEALKIVKDIIDSEKNGLSIGAMTSQVLAIYIRYRNIKRKLKKRYYLYKQNLIPLNSLVTSYICYKGLCERDFKFLKR